MPAERFTLKSLKKNAKQVLYSDLICHILAPLCVIACITGIEFAGYSLIYLSDNISYTLFSVLSTAVSLMVVLVSIPLFYGLFVFYYNCANGARADLADIFYAFGSAYVYRRSFFLFFALLWRFAVCFSIPLIITGEFFMYINNMPSVFAKTNFYGYDLTYTLVCVSLFLFYFISAAIFSKYTLGIYISVRREGLPVSLCFIMAKSFGYIEGSLYFIMFATFLPLAVLSVLTFGIVFILYALPFITLALFMLSKHIYDNEIEKNTITSLLTCE